MRILLANVLSMLFFFLSSVMAQDLVLRSKVTQTNAPRLNLILNENYLITHTLGKSRAGGKYGGDVINFQNLAWKLDPQQYKTLKKYLDDPLSQITNKDFDQKYKIFFDQLKGTKEFQTIRDQTVAYMSDSLIEWDQNLKKTLEFMIKYSGFAFNHEVNAYLTHPAVGNGRMQDEKEKILSFGDWPKFDNYFTVYIWHEILHFHMPLNEINHVAIQFLTDNQLRVFLNGGTMIPFYGHEELFPIMEKNLSLWESYLKNPTDLITFANSCEQ